MKRTAPTWLRESFRDGIDNRDGGDAYFRDLPYPGAKGWCWLAQHDSQRRPCSAKLERFHFIGRQRISNALYNVLLPESWDHIRVMDLLELAEWDARNGGIACEYHHRRFDNHLTPSLVVPADALPAHVLEFAADWGLDDTDYFQRRFPAQLPEAVG